MRIRRYSLMRARFPYPPPHTNDGPPIVIRRFFTKKAANRAWVAKADTWRHRTGTPLSHYYVQQGFSPWVQFREFMGWHGPDKNAPMAFTGASWQTTCRYCHKRILQDSQGSWF